MHINPNFVTINRVFVIRVHLYADLTTDIEPVSMTTCRHKLLKSDKHLYDILVINSSIRSQHFPGIFVFSKMTHHSKHLG